MNRSALLSLFLLAGPLACVTTPTTPRNRAEAEVRAKAEFLCQHELLYSLTLTHFPEGARPEDYARREDVLFRQQHPQKASDWPLDTPGLAQELARYVHCEVSDVRFIGDTVSVTLRRTAPAWRSPGFPKDAALQASTREEVRAVLERWMQQKPETPTTEHRVHFVWTHLGWRVGYWLPEKAAYASAPGHGARPTPPLSFSDSMTPPRPVSAPKVQYTREAHDNGVQGLAVLQCLLTREGRVEDCHVLKALPYLSEPAAQALQASRYTPVLMNGEPIDIEYTFNLAFMLPSR
jgi:Gram-negative bacterial TonB protein C-terminal